MILMQAAFQAKILTLIARFNKDSLYMDKYIFLRFHWKFYSHCACLIDACYMIFILIITQCISIKMINDKTR